MSETPLDNPLKDFASVLRYLLRWVPIAVLTGMMAGTASALLIWSLNLATRIREAHIWLIALLPVAGLLVSCLYQYLGADLERGNNLIIDEVHDPHQTVPLRLTPLILFGTFMTHVFGGSAGREGTAVQTGASLADQLGRPFRMSAVERRILLMCGISAGFASVFGTPLAGAVFGLEVLAIGAVSYEALVPCIVAAFTGDLVTRDWGIVHGSIDILFIPNVDAKGLLVSALAGAIFGLVAMAFARSAHAIADLCRKYITWIPMRPFAGGIVVALGVWAIHSTKYIGLGDKGIEAAFTGPQPAVDWIGKFLFTVVTLGSGFKGGEVTPLFFIGATLGNALGNILPLPTPLLAGLGFVGVFAGAANTPIASTLMAMELFGAEAGAFAGVACIFSYLFSGNSGIYQSQKVELRKGGRISADADGSLPLRAKVVEPTEDAEPAEDTVPTADAEHASELHRSQP
ncbi:MAG: voltage-gated chloride channel family protein [Janthinobacterium lividum]